MQPEPRPNAAPAEAGSKPAVEPRLAAGPLAFLWDCLLRRRAAFAGLFSLVALAAGCAVGVQYGMKLIVDSMAGDAGRTGVWSWLALFMGLIAAEATLW